MRLPAKTNALRWRPCNGRYFPALGRGAVVIHCLLLSDEEGGQLKAEMGQEGDT